MKKEPWIHPQAERELELAGSYYEQQKAGLGRDLYNEFQRALDGVIEFPEAAAVVRGDVRRKLFSKFPYAIYYSTRRGIRVVAVGHLHRRPYYWWRRR